MKLVYSYFVLDIVHRGHILMLQNSKSVAGSEGKLIVGIVADDAILMHKGRLPILSFEERLEIARSIKYIDLVVEQNDYSPVNNIKKIRPNILMESDSHTSNQIQISRDEMDKIGGQVIVIPYFNGQSSTSIKKKIMAS
jgi:cytidyltransferase-like protein